MWLMDEWIVHDVRAMSWDKHFQTSNILYNSRKDLGAYNCIDFECECIEADMTKHEDQ